jgi:hypothetical protein
VSAASHVSAVVTISAEATHSAQAAQVGSSRPTTAQANAKATAQLAKANAEHAAQNPTPAPAPRVHGVYLSPAPAPLSLDPIPSQHLPPIAYDPADVNQDGRVTSYERQEYDFHHPPTLAAQPGPAEADLSSYTSIARG